MGQAWRVHSDRPPTRPLDFVFEDVRVLGPFSVDRSGPTIEIPGELPEALLAVRDALHQEV
jgi:hypothetical protein